MVNTIHIVNGDVVVPILTGSGIEGDIIVWREMLCDGPISGEVGGDEFWKKRLNYFEKEFDVSKLEYFDNTIKELLKLEDLSNYNELVMWFEFDLFCQVNLMALSTFLYKNFRKTITYNLVCSGKVKGNDKLHSLTDFSPEDFKELYNTKLKVNKTDLEYAKKCWEAYSKNNIEKITAFDFSENNKFSYFEPAIKQHLKRFQTKNGLNEIQNKILELIDSSALTANDIVRDLLIWQHKETIYGFGDMQYFSYLKKLSDFVQISEEKYFLNASGKTMINQ